MTGLGGVGNGHCFGCGHDSVWGTKRRHQTCLPFHDCIGGSGIRNTMKKIDKKKRKKRKKNAIYLLCTNTTNVKKKKK
jgi:hypothetical protein